MKKEKEETRLRRGKRIRAIKFDIFMLFTYEHNISKINREVHGLRDEFDILQIQV